MKTEINIDELKEIYLISNTASFLYDRFLKDETIDLLAQNHKTPEIINFFLELATNEITVLDDLIAAYAAYMAIILKNDAFTYSFLKDKGVIDFEWFNELRSIYFARLKSIDVFNFESKISHIQTPKIIQSSSEYLNIQTI